LAKSSKPVNYVASDAKIGKNVRIWHFAYVGSKTTVGDNVKIGSLAHVDYDVKIGSGTMIEGMVYIPPLSKIGKNVFIGPAAVLTNDPYPPSKRMIGITIEDEAIIGARAVIRAGVRVGRRAVVAMGAVVTKDVPPGMVVMGVPAKVAYTREEFDAKMKKWERGSSS
jgi:acetyltransferase-like isoleucine patch superfamily enzyme